MKDQPYIDEVNETPLNDYDNALNDYDNNDNESEKKYNYKGIDNEDNIRVKKHQKRNKALSIGKKCVKYASSNFYRYFLAAATQNFCSFFFWILVPLIAVELDVDAWLLGLYPGLSSLEQAFLSLAIGKLSDIIPGTVLTHLALTIFSINCCFGILWGSSSKIILMILCLIHGIVSALFWPVVQGSIGKEAPKGMKSTHLGRFAMGWSIGKSFGYLIGGYFKSLMGVAYSFLFIIVFDATATLYYPCATKLRKKRKVRQVINPLKMQIDVPPKSTPETITREKTERRIRHRNITFQIVGYFMNFSIYGITSMIANQYTKLGKDRQLKLPFKGVSLGGDDTEFFLGLFFCVLYLGQTASFFIMSLSKIWQFKFFLIFMSQFLLICVQLLLIFTDNALILLATSVVHGLVAGFSYQSSLLYSMEAAGNNPGIFIGISEAINASAIFFMPFLGGLLTTITGSLLSPYFFGIATAAVILILQTVIYIVLNIFFYFLRKKPSRSELIDTNPLTLSNINVEQVLGVDTPPTVACA